ncbi:MAG: DsrE family protein [Proteobacteria bacterium]|nr:DsrE family protein [Pseudomonadota bacterium]
MFRVLRALAISVALGLGGSAAVAAPDPMTAPPPADYYKFQKVVYQNDGGYPDAHAYFERLLRHLGAHLAATNGKVEIRVVSFAEGVKLLQMAKTDAGLAGSLDKLRAQGVRFLVCRNSMRGMGLKPEDLYKVDGADIVPSGVAEIARLQGLGFVYEHP